MYCLNLNYNTLNDIFLKWKEKSETLTIEHGAVRTFEFILVIDEKLSCELYTEL